ncbi:MAG: aminotransferase class V-fold PLP-dependent enzyme, partial [bacterium]
VDSGGCIDLDALDAALDPAKTALVSVMWANNETGTIQPIAAIAARCAAAGVPFHSDAVQATGKIPIDLAEYPGLTMLSLAGHKIHGPKGIGALIVRQGTRLEPFTFGGHQEQGLRPGTENVPGIVGLGAAAVAATKCLATQVERIAMLRDRFEQSVIDTIPDVRRNGDPATRTANTANLCFQGIPASAALLMLDQAGIACSAGSACCAGQTTASHVLKSMGLCDADGRASLRFSLSRYTTPEDIDAAIEALQRIIPELRSMSGYKDEAAVARYRAAQPVAE